MPRAKLTAQDRAMAAAIGATTPMPSAASSRRGSESREDEQATTGLPPAAYYVIVVETCERFCFDGLRVMLILYFMYYFHLDQNTATVDYHSFTFVYHITPLFGAILADGFIGRYLTILILAIVYFIGTFVLSITAVPQIGHHQLLGPFLGLFAIACGSGGIKPCVGTFCADQVPASNVHNLARMFSIYYFAMQVGSFISTIITPLLRSQVQCFGYDCYSLAFALPSALMLFAIIIFVIGTPLYKRITPKENIIAKFYGVIWRSIRNGIWCSKSKTKKRWLDYADDKYSASDINDVHSVFRVFKLFLPLSVYQALQNQKSSRWTLQASSMSGSLGPYGTLQPDQIQALGFLFVLLLIPLFEQVIYPAAARFNWLKRSLQRIYLGLIFTALAYVVTALLQQTIEAKADAVPVRYFAQIYNGYHCPVFINAADQLEPGAVYQFPCGELQDGQLSVNSTCDQQSVSFKLAIDKLCPSVMVISNGNQTADTTEMQLTPLTNPISRTRGVQQYALLRMVFLNGTNDTVVTIVPNRYEFHIEGSLLPTEYQSVLEERYQIETISTGQQPRDSFYVERTAVYTVLLVNTDENKVRAILFEDVPPFTVHMLWQAFPYLFLTSGEVLVSLTALIFAYSQAPKRYKVIISSLWIMTSSMGDVVVIIVAKSHFATTQAGEFLFYAVLMMFAAYIFGVMSIRYNEDSLIEPVHGPSEDQQLLTETSVSH